MITQVPDVRALADVLSVSAVRLARRLRRRRADPHISLSQLSALSALVREGATTPGTLAAREGVRPPTMTRVIARLAETNLIDRSPHPTDGRQIIVAASPTGLAFIADKALPREEWLTEQLSKLSADEITLLTKAVAIINQILVPGTPAAAVEGAARTTG
ncbi:MarR family transcriptional regulator [Nocardia sp. NPDC058480]|uniref:MarR family transcriptional regulator n=1 Tax=Nocardia sp. NPDC058480 TaxID=3346522 RepID=UPI003653366A